jgi:glycosyltransferase involved in cell wall biosynthesis
MTDDLPRISIVTPSYNQAPYLFETFVSVLGQHYPQLEYVVMDGGSTDGSVEIIRQFEHQLAFWTSAPDRGQAAAINAGFARCSGDILAWLNSDDAYLPGALHVAARLLDSARAQVLHGDTIFFSEETRNSVATQIARNIDRLDPKWASTILQPSAFTTRRAWELTGPLDEELEYAMDWDWFIRARNAGVEFIPCHRPLSIYRRHGLQKTIPGQERLRELRGIYRKYNGDRGEHLFVVTRGKRAQTLLMRALLKANPLPSLADAIVRACFPLLSLRYSPREIESTVRMV